MFLSFSSSVWNTREIERDVFPEATHILFLMIRRQVSLSPFSALKHTSITTEGKRSIWRGSWDINVVTIRKDSQEKGAASNSCVPCVQFTEREREKKVEGLAFEEVGRKNSKSHFNVPLVKNTRSTSVPHLCPSFRLTLLSHHQDTRSRQSSSCGDGSFWWFLLFLPPNVGNERILSLYHSVLWISMPSSIHPSDSPNLFTTHSTVDKFSL